MLGDFIKRYKSSTNEVFFNIGLDENGSKIYETAKKLNIPIKNYLDELYLKWIDFCKLFNISYSNFYRTTSEEHHRKVKLFWLSCLAKGDLYKKIYESKYCIGCESFKTEKDLIAGKCPDHFNLKISNVSEENWFFKLSNYKNDILKYVTENEFLIPTNKLQELVNQIKDSEDISVSRKKDKVCWGVDVPNDSEQLVYVWFDALLNYIIAAGYGEKEFDENWENSVQICGPDNLKFQALIFQSFLKSQDIPFTKKLLVHGTVTDAKGNKISKTVGNVIDPIEQLEKYGVEPIRYYILAGLNTYSNNGWNEKDLVNLYNSEIVDGFGNLVARTLHLIDKSEIEITEPSFLFKSYIDELSEKSKNLLNNYEIKEGLKIVSDIVRYCNSYINEKKPWIDNDVEVLNNLYYALVVVSEYYGFVLPSKSQEIKDTLINKKKVILFKKI